MLCVLIILILGAMAAYHFLPEVTKRRNQQTRLDELKLQVEQQRQMLIRNQRTAELLIHDPDYIGLVARDLLGLMKEGETIYRFDPPKPDKANMHLIH